MLLQEFCSFNKLAEVLLLKVVKSHKTLFPWKKPSLTWPCFTSSSHKKASTLFCLHPKPTLLFYIQILEEMSGSYGRFHCAERSPSPPPKSNFMLWENKVFFQSSKSEQHTLSSGKKKSWEENLSESVPIICWFISLLGEKDAIRQQKKS